MARQQVVMPIKTLLSRERNQKYLVEASKSHRQLSYIGRLSKRNHRLKLSTSDLDSVERASAWILNAGR